MDIYDFYRSVLQCANVEVEVGTDLLLLCTPDGAGTPLTIEKKPVALPTKARLKAAEDNVVLFHPVSESLIRKESPVLRQLRKLLITRLNDVALTVIEALVLYAADTANHKKASPDQRDFLSLVPDLKVSTQDKILKVLDQVDGKLNTRIVSQLLRSGDRLDGEEYKRVSHITFPLLNTFDQNAKTWGGVKFSLTDLRTIRALLEYVLPNWESKGSYSTGTHEMAAPGFHGMMKGLLPVYEQLNRVISIFDLDDSNLFDVTYGEGLGSIAKYRARIPVQPGNTGDPLDTDPEDGEIPGHARSKVAQNDDAEPQQTTKPTTVAKPKVADDPVPEWKRQIQEREERARSHNGAPHIDGEISPEEYKKLTWSDRKDYDAWYRGELQRHEEQIQIELQRAQGWRQPQTQWGGQQAGYSQPASGYGQPRLSPREEYESRRQQHSRAPLSNQLGMGGYRSTRTY